MDIRCRRASVQMSCSTSLDLTRVLPSSILTAVSPSPRTTRVSVRSGDSPSHRDAVRIAPGSTPELVSDGSLSAWRAKATTSSSPLE